MGARKLKAMRRDNEMAFLQVLSEEGGARFDVTSDKVTLGRAADNDIVLPETAVSSHHCCVLRQGAAFMLKDLDSTNGTILDGELVKEAPLKPGDIFQVAGEVDVLFGDEGMEVPIAAEEEVAAEEVQRITAPARSDSIPPGFEPRHDPRSTRVTVVLVCIATVFAAGVWFLLRLMRA